MRVRSFSHVGMTVKSLRRSIEFYWGHFGLPVLGIWEIPSDVIKKVYGLDNKTKVRFAVLRCGWGSFVEIFEFTPSEKAVDVKWNRHGLTHLSLEVGNVKKAYKRLKDEGVKLVVPPLEVANHTFAYLKDPDGNLVEIGDMGIRYLLNKFLGGIAGWINMKTKFRDLSKI